ERIKAALEKTCNVLPSVVQPVCRQFVNKFQSALISAFLNMEPEQICSYLSLCDFQLKLKLSLGSIECDVCQDAVREFMNEIQEPSITKEIVSIINDTCGILPDDLKTECFTYVDQYGSLVTQFIAQFFDPITTCTVVVPY
ncbi:saposin-C-like, partial [Diadema antillarum]|uniref:saposin-C-like n=1 Tax=Diadema antillarum TaxID=105358 RepID=UPI003A8741C0